MGNLEDQSSLLLILPLPIYWHEGEYFCDDQACNGLALWLKNFDTVTLCCPMIAVDVVPGNNLPLTELCRDERLSVVPMPSAWTFIEFFWAIVPTITKIRRLIETHRYLQFAIGGLWGDWGAVSILVASAMDRKCAVWTDSVASGFVASHALDARFTKRFYLKAVATLMWQYEKFVVKRSSLGLFHGMDTYSAYSPYSRAAYLVHDIHLAESDRISPLELREKANRPDKRILQIIYAGRVHRDKGVMEWIDTLAHAKQLGVAFEAVWYGEGPLLEEARAQTVRSGLDKMAKFPGQSEDRKQLMQAIRQADIFLFCHKTPESPRCLVEALISGTPIVGFKSAYPSDLIAKNKGGVLTDPSAATLAAELHELLSTPCELAKLSQQAARDAFPLIDTEVFRHRSEIIKTMTL